MDNKPHGILFVALKLTTYLLKVVYSTDILNYADNHGALF